MKKTKLIFLTVFFIFYNIYSYSSVKEQFTVATKMLYFNSSGLINQSSEILTAAVDSSCASFSQSMKTLFLLDGIYYQVFQTKKFNPIGKVVLRKSTDGINWTSIVRAGDTPDNKEEYHPNIYVWKKNNNTNVGVVFVDSRGTVKQVRYSRSTNGGNSFLPSVEISNYGNDDAIFLGGFDGKGDTLVACWSRPGGLIMFNKSTNGGVTWGTMSSVFSGGFFSLGNDLVIDNDVNLYSIIGADQSSKINIIVRKSTNLGTVWNNATPITNVSTQLMNQFHQSKFINNKIYTIWERNFNTSTKMSDGIFFSLSSDQGVTWTSPVDISDTDTIYNSNSNNPFEMHPSIAITQSGTIYAAWADSRNGNAPLIDSCKFNIYVSRSTNNGVTWSQNIQVNGPSNYSRVFNAYSSISVKSNGGIDSVLVSWTKLRDANLISVIKISSEIPQRFSLSQNYPNPFNPETKLKFEIPDNSYVNLTIFDINGRIAEVLIDKEINAGIYELGFNAANLSSGVYFYRIQAGKFIDTKKMLLVK